VQVAAAVADPVRRNILDALRAGPLPVNRIDDRFAISRPAVSRHLRVLRECGLVTVEARGRERWCSLDPAPLAELERWLARFRSPLAGHLDALDTEVARTRRQRRRAPNTDRREDIA